MERLISLAELLEKGYKHTRTNLCVKGKSKRYVRCGCHKWTNLSGGADKFGKVSGKCFWCNKGLVVTVIQ